MGGLTNKSDRNGTGQFPDVLFCLSVHEQAGHLVGHVRNDEGITKRVSNCTPIPLGYHADNSDIVFLACRTQAKSGGATFLLLTRAALTGLYTMTSHCLSH